MSYLQLNRFPLIFTTADIAYDAKPKATRITMAINAKEDIPPTAFRMLLIPSMSSPGKLKFHSRRIFCASLNFFRKAALYLETVAHDSGFRYAIYAYFKTEITHSDRFMALSNSVHE